MKSFLILALISLVLLIGIQESFEYGGQKPDPRVCGDRLCTEIPGGREAWESKDKTIQENMAKPEIAAISSPLRQMKNGISPGDVTCKEGLVLIIKHNDSAACVRLDTAVKLEEHGWGVMPPPCCKPTEVSSIDSFEECVAAGNPVMESYPRQCRTVDGKHFVEFIPTQNNQKIGHEFILRIYEPDANRDSKDEDKIPLGAIEFRSEGGIRTNLSKSTFDANSSNLIETGPNTDIFEVKITIPRSIDGKTIHIGDWFEITYFDVTSPSETINEIVLRGNIGS